ncbi:MAG: hypothetical protein LCI02_23345 [Proteobacteria bacterium]|nr:hypothetical protein [Pseudomonadota bacterium]
MSIAVELHDLGQALARYRFAYLLTSSAEGAAPHAVAVAVRWEDGALLIDGAGRRTRDNAQQRPAVGLVWPPADAADYSLIVDGRAAVDGERLRIAPTRAVLHRPAPASAKPAEPGRCGADCVELSLEVGAAAPAAAGVVQQGA